MTHPVRSCRRKTGSSWAKPWPKELCREYAARDSALADKHDMSALFRIGYGLYVVTSNDGKRDNGLIVNTVTQVCLTIPTAWP